MRASLLLCLCWICGGLLRAGEVAGTVIDRPVRFVNDRVVTIGDIRARNALRLEMFRRSARVPPDVQSREGLLRFNRDTLEELTDEELLIQKADELKVQVDRDRLAQEVVAEARERGFGLSDIAILRRQREREYKIEAVLGWLGSRTAAVSPADERRSYDAGIAAYTRPPRARTLLIALRPTSEDERRELLRAQAGLMREAQGADDPAIREAAAGRLDAFLAADLAGQGRLLAEVAAAVASREAAGLSPGAAALVRLAGDLVRRQAAAATREECLARLAALRSELIAMPAEAREAAFRERARSISQGPQAADGGLLGWVEPGTFGPEIEEHALAMPVGEPSEPFWTGGAAAMVLVVAREDARVQPFDEVRGALSAGLDRQRRQDMRSRLSAVLRAQASVRDVVDLDELLR